MLSSHHGRSLNNTAALPALILTYLTYLSRTVAFVPTAVTGGCTVSSPVAFGSPSPSATLSTRQRVHHHCATASNYQSRPEYWSLPSGTLNIFTKKNVFRGGGRYGRHQLEATATPGEAVDTPDNTPYEAEESPGRPLAPLDSQVQLFEEWISRTSINGENGEAKIRLSHASFDGLRGLMTTSAVRPWEPLVTLPLSSTLVEYMIPSHANSLPPPEPLSMEAWERCPWWVRLGVRLLKEKALGEASHLSRYVDILPQAGAPLSWTAEQLERLYYPRLRSCINVQRRLFRGFRKFLLADATRPTTKNNGNGAGEPTDVQLLIGSLSDSAAFDWALECVLSRAFQLPPDTARRPSFGDGDADDVPTRAPEVQPPAPDDVRMALLPVIDSLNHYSRMPTTMYWEEDGKAISVAVGAHLDPGDHAFLSYGMVSNDDLLQYYCFVERQNPSDTYVMQDLGKVLRKDGLLTTGLVTRLLSCPAAREVWRYLRKGVLLRDAVHPITMQAMRIVCCDGGSPSSSGQEHTGESGGVDESPPPPPRWNGTEADLARFAAPVSLGSEIDAFELIMKYTAMEADAWGDAGVACAVAEDPTADGLDGDLDGLGLDDDQRLMLSVFRQEKVRLLRGVVSRLTQMRKVSGMLQRPIKMPAMGSPPAVLGGSVR